MDEEVVQQADSNCLHPFDHQVAGQSLVFQYDATTICKSLIPHEHDVYRALPAILKPFIPEYRGMVDIPLKDHVSTRACQESGNGLQATQRHLAKVARSDEQEHVYHFILLENLVACFSKPCVLDLKMGTRQHGDNAPLEKVEYQVNKCRNTTSSALGVRLCGMKVYQATTGQYLAKDKAEGRRMRQQDFEQAVSQFLHNGHSLRRDVIPAILERLRRLKVVIEQLPTYRFYSSSLLIVYDGLVTQLSPPPTRHTAPSRRPRVRPGGGQRACGHHLGDSGHYQRQGTGQTHSGADAVSDDKVGVSCACDSCSIEPYSGLTLDYTESNVPAFGVGLGVGVAEDNDGDGDTDRSPVRDHSCRVDVESRVDVRLVDFAHTTFSGLGLDTGLHNGADHGCLLGLQTLVDIFTRMQQSSD